MMPRSDRNDDTDDSLGVDEVLEEERDVAEEDELPEELIAADVALSSSTGGPSWLASLFGGLLSTLLVFIFLGYLQPTLGSSEAIALPDLVQLQTGLGSNRKPPPPPKRDREQKQERKSQQKRPKQIVRKAAPRTKQARAQQTGQRFAGALTMNLGIGLPGGGGGAVLPISMNLEETSDEETRAIGEYIRTRDRVRDESRTRGGVTREFVAAGGREPQVLLEPDDIYPRKALQDAIEGFVLLNALISASGSISAFEILGAQPEGVFEDAVIDSLDRWRFSPAEDSGGRPVEMWKKLKIDFQLEK